MHRLPSKGTLHKFRIVSLLCILMSISVPSTLAMLGYGFFGEDDRWILNGGIAGGVGVLCLLLVSLMGARLRCPLCTMPVFHNRRCSRHRNAKALFGSHRLKVAITILLKGRFRCPYCGEPTGMVVRDRRAGQGGR